MNEITPKMISDWIENLDYSHASKISILSRLSSIYKYGEKYYDIKNIISKVDRPRNLEAPKEMQIWTMWRSCLRISAFSLSDPKNSKNRKEAANYEEHGKLKVDYAVSCSDRLWTGYSLFFDSSIKEYPPGRLAANGQVCYGKCVICCRNFGRRYEKISQHKLTQLAEAGRP